VIAAILALIVAAGCGYLVFATMRVRACSLRQPTGGRSPSVTIFKPLRGLDPAMFENLGSFCDQDYPSFHVLFCVRDETDPAIPVVRRVIDAHPDVDCTLVIDGAYAARNPKVANIMGARSAARGDVFVIADADVRAERGMLRSLVRAFDDPAVGAASLLYRASALANDVPSRLGALHVNDHFLPSVLVATARRAPEFCLGAVMAVRRTVLNEIGGFEAIGQHLGDDFALGNLVASKGHRVALVPAVVTCVVEEATIGAFFRHQLRWARTIRFQAPLGYAFLFVTFPLPLALALVLWAGFALWSIALLAAVALARVALHEAVRQKFDTGGISPLIVLSDIFELLTWVCSFFGTVVDWRGDRFNAAQERARRAR
jgi:ceramide glucosyltransferase